MKEKVEALLDKLAKVVDEALNSLCDELDDVRTDRGALGPLAMMCLELHEARGHIQAAKRRGAEFWFAT